MIGRKEKSKMIFKLLTLSTEKRELLFCDMSNTEGVLSGHVEGCDDRVQTLVYFLILM